MLGSQCFPCCQSCRDRTFRSLTAIEVEYESADLLVKYDGTATAIGDYSSIGPKGSTKDLSYTVAYKGSAITGVFSLSPMPGFFPWSPPFLDNWRYSGGNVAPWCGDFEGVQATQSIDVLMQDRVMIRVSAGGNITGGLDDRGVYRSINGCSVINDFKNVLRRCHDLENIEHRPNLESGLTPALSYFNGNPQESIAWAVKEVVHATPGFYYQVGIMYYPIVKTHRVTLQF